MRRRLFSTIRALQHQNPLGLPRTGAPPPLPRAQRGLPQKRRIPSVSKVICVSSAKGGVGKSTLAANLAISLARQGRRAGLLDADLFGPSVPRLLGLDLNRQQQQQQQQHVDPPRVSARGLLLPLVNHGVKSMSMGYLVAAEAPVVWRGLMVMKALQQLLFDVDWGGLDVLVLDLPPGTGDTQLTVTQQVVLDGAIVVSTPQDIALIDAVKGINMFKKVDVPILGMVQNMSVFTCPNCQHSTHIFGSEGVVRECRKHGIELLGDIPLDASICSDADLGKPTVAAREGPLTDAYNAIAMKVSKQLWD